MILKGSARVESNSDIKKKNEKKNTRYNLAMIGTPETISPLRLFLFKGKGRVRVSRLTLMFEKFSCFFRLIGTVKG